MSNLFSFYIYLALVVFITLMVLGLSLLFPRIRMGDVKFMPYESGIQTKTNLLKERFPLRHFLVALIFLVFDVEVIFLYPWAVIAKTIGIFAFYEMGVFLIALMIGLLYVWRKGGLEWDS